MSYTFDSLWEAVSLISSFVPCQVHLCFPEVALCSITKGPWKISSEPDLRSVGDVNWSTVLTERPGLYNGAACAHLVPAPEGV